MKPAQNTEQFDYAKFKEYLQGIVGGNRSAETANSICADVALFFELTPTSSTMVPDCVDMLCQ